jgi:N-acetyl-anhydromuramyl-L-alanine amidase AmpD
MIETDIWPFIPAKWFTAVDHKTPRRVRLVVIHDMEFPEQPNAAEVIARDFATRSANNKASAHVCIDNDSIIQCVHDRDVAYAAPGANTDGIHLELAGFGKQTREQWLDTYGQALLGNAANVTAQYCLKYGIPVQRLTNEQLAQGMRGIVGHVQVSQVYHKSDHTDPGPNFPWDVLLTRAAQFYTERQQRKTIA